MTNGPNPEPKPYTLARPRPRPVFGAFRDTVDTILAAAETAPRKQLHTATQVYRRLVAEYGYTGNYDPVRRRLKEERLAIPFDECHGVRAQDVAPSPSVQPRSNPCPVFV
jgi:hypothetical protein